MATAKVRHVRDALPGDIVEVLLADDSHPNMKPMLCLRLQRKATKFILSVSMPICMLVLLASSTFFVPTTPSDLQVRYLALPSHHPVPLDLY